MESVALAVESVAGPWRSGGFGGGGGGGGIGWEVDAGIVVGGAWQGWLRPGSEVRPQERCQGVRLIGHVDKQKMAVVARPCCGPQDTVVVLE